MQEMIFLKIKNQLWNIMNHGISSISKKSCYLELG